MVRHLQSRDQTMALEDSAWQAMPHFSEIRCTMADQNTGGELLKFSVRTLSMQGTSCVSSAMQYKVSPQDCHMQW